MSEDGAKTREQLEQLAAEGRARAEAQQAVEAQADEQSQKELRREQNRVATLSTFSAWRSTSWWFDLAWWFGVLSVLSLPLAFVIQSLPWSMMGLGVSALCAGLAWWSRERVLAFIRSHPFPLLGYAEALHHPARDNGRHEVTIKIVFVNRISDGKTLNDALRAGAGRYFSRANYGGHNLVLALIGPRESDMHGHARWLHRAMRRHILRVLHTVHATMSIERVTLKGD